MGYNYKIKAGNYGGEYTIGTISKSTSEYWLAKGEKEFSEYVFAIDKDEENLNIPENHKLNEWHEIDNIMHESCLEFSDSNWFQIINTETAESFYIDFSKIDKNTLVIDNSEMTKAMNSEEEVVFGQSFEKCSYEVICYDNEYSECAFTTNEPFDVKKIKNVSVSKWSDLLLLNSFEYEEYRFDLTPVGNSAVKSMNAWIHNSKK
jgi:hypothetical protein|tara:strand:- start:123 stop:737 length:615 start_codon:yes stop_codon:yes gene_type:complete